MTNLGAIRTWIIRLLAAVIFIYCLLLFPVSAPIEPPAGEKSSFVWNQDQYWASLEDEFRMAREASCPDLIKKIDSSFAGIAQLLDSIGTINFSPEAAPFARLEALFFQLAPQIAVCRNCLPEYMQTFNRMRSLLKRQSRNWDMNSRAARDRIYRLLFGGRIAIEEIMLQMPPDSVVALSKAEEVFSATPEAEILGATIHSGDILVSRGGAATSALISRGNDYPGNFSHVALVYVDEKTGQASVIESHIEKGVAIATLEQYLMDTKLRVMVLRLRPDLPALIFDPILPHKAAEWAYDRARASHIPYDFEMDYNDSTKWFCSEVAATAYRHYGIKLWIGLSHISSVGIKSWLAAFGVTHFETMEPSDLEYDPQLIVVAEWRALETLYKEHIDNAVIDIMLEDADAGERLNYNWYVLPVARIMKGYSLLLNAIGRVGPVPEGMSAASALRNKWFTARHEKLKERLLVLAEKFKQENGYTAPYWKLIELARQAKNSL
jgi:hypothetical protein